MLIGRVISTVHKPRSFQSGSDRCCCDSVNLFVGMLVHWVDPQLQTASAGQEREEVDDLQSLSRQSRQGALMQISKWVASVQIVEDRENERKYRDALIPAGFGEAVEGGTRGWCGLGTG